MIRHMLINVNARHRFPGKFLGFITERDLNIEIESVFLSIVKPVSFYVRNASLFHSLVKRTYYRWFQALPYTSIPTNRSINRKA